MEQSNHTCYARYEEGLLTIGNELVERVIRLDGARPLSVSFTDKKNNKVWTAAREVVQFQLPVLDFDQTSCDVAFQSVEGGLRAELNYTSPNAQVKQVYWLFEGIPCISSQLFVKGGAAQNAELAESEQTGNENAVVLQEYGDIIQSEPDTVDAFPISDRHLRLKTVELLDVTDRHNNLVKEDIQYVYSFGLQRFCGNLFFFENALDQTAFFAVKEAPARHAMLNSSGADMLMSLGNYAGVRGSGLDYQNLSPDEYYPCYYVTLGACAAGEGERAYKRYYRRVSHQPTYIMSNTWGDRHQDAAVCEECMLRELEEANRLGVDVVQIDDGWETGTTSNSALAKSDAWGGGYYDQRPDFWAVNPTKFPNGLKPLVLFAREHKIRLGLWFSPDLSDEYAQWERYAQTLIDLYNRYGVLYFKLDGIKFTSRQSEQNMVKMVRRVQEETGGAVDFNFDITAQIRWGYFYQKQYGKLFVENRYTDWGNYYPHATLRNLWELSRYVPAQRMQFELLNLRRNPQNYPDDPLAPIHYRMDYVFASVMLSNPLVWMEMSELEEQDREDLARVIACYKKERALLDACLVSPVGQIPTGLGFTGFLAEGAGEGYLVLLRELTEADTFDFSLPLNQPFSVETLYGCAELEPGQGEIKVKFPSPRSFVFAKYTVHKE